MNCLQATTLACVLGLSVKAQAETFVLDYETLPTAADPEAGFEADCLGTTEAASCAQRAALLEAELVEILASLEGRRDEEAVALFASAVNAGSPQLEQIGLRYFARKRNLPTGLWAKVKEFFFGADANLGQPSAELLRDSTDAIDQALSEIYLEARPYDAYGGYLPEGAGAADEWAEAQAKDALWNAVSSFSDEDKFVKTTRLLMVDRFVGKHTDPTQIPVSGFVTDAPKSEVIAHFTKVFGKAPYPSLTDTQRKLQELNTELLALQERLLGGDASAGEKLAELIEEVTTVQESASLGSLLQLEELGSVDDIFWTDNVASEELYSMPVRRAVSVGTDPLLRRTTIRYFAGEGTGAAPDDGGDGDGDSGDGDGGDGDANSDAPPTDGSGKKSGGGCMVAPPNTEVPWLLLLVACATLLRRLRRATSAPNLRG